MGTIINSLGYSAGVVDGNASVQGAAEALSKNPSDPGLKAAYDAAYANAVAAETALIPGVGAVFASSAIKMDLQSISINGANPSNLISLASNIAILASHGIALSAALAGGEVAVTVGATTFALSELVVQVGPRCAPAVQTAASMRRNPRTTTFQLCPATTLQLCYYTVFVDNCDYVKYRISTKQRLEPAHTKRAKRRRPLPAATIRPNRKPVRSTTTNARTGRGDRHRSPPTANLQQTHRPAQDNIIPCIRCEKCARSAVSINDRNSSCVIWISASWSPASK